MVFSAKKNDVASCGSQSDRIGMRFPRDVFASLFALTIVGVCGVGSSHAEQHVILDTELGDILIEIYEDAAPISAADFLRYVDEGRFEGGGFHRVVRLDNDNGRPKIEIIQGGVLDPAKELPPIKHETTRETGLAHMDGAVSLSRGAPGTGTGADFFICIGDQPSLDYGGIRNTDGQGFAVFGQVVSGMDVVRRIHQLPATAETVEEYVRGQVLETPLAINSARQVKM